MSVGPTAGVAWPLLSRETERATLPVGGVPALILFWYACRVRHPARPRWLAFLMGLAAIIGVTAATLAGLHYFITVRDGSPFMLVPVMLSYPFVLRATIRGWLRSPPHGHPTVPGPADPSGP